MIKIDPCEKNNQKQISDANLGFAINQEIRSPKQVNRRVNGGMMFQFKKEAVPFLSTICSHLMKKSPVTSYFARCLRCLSLCYPSLTDNCKSQYSKFISGVTKEYKSDFFNFDKSEHRVDEFLWNYVGNAPSFTDL